MNYHDHWFTRGAHVCQFADGINDSKAVLLPFLRDGLLNNEFCLCITGADTTDEWCYELQAFGIDVLAETQRGALRLLARHEWRQPHRRFRSLAQARKALRLVPWTRFNGARVIYDAGWALGPDLPAEDLCHWEATATLLYSGLPVRVICQYDMQQHSLTSLDAALRTHPYVLSGEAIVANPYCQADEILEFEPLLNYSSTQPGEVIAKIAEVTGGGVVSGFSKKSFLHGTWSRLNT